MIDCYITISTFEHVLFDLLDTPYSSTFTHKFIDFLFIPRKMCVLFNFILNWKFPVLYVRRILFLLESVMLHIFFKVGMLTA